MMESFIDQVELVNATLRSYSQGRTSGSKPPGPIEQDEITLLKEILPLLQMLDYISLESQHRGRGLRHPSLIVFFDVIDVVQRKASLSSIEGVRDFGNRDSVIR